MTVPTTTRSNNNAMTVFSAVTCLLLLGASVSAAYVPPPSSSSSSPSAVTTRKSRTTRLFASIRNDDDDAGCDATGSGSRREALRRGFGITLGCLLGGTLSNPRNAEATYSAYAAREKDWESRQKKGEIRYSSARSLRAQLQEIVPQNSEESRMFCPNGPSANVSPLMENKCSDVRTAVPSVYGRSDDVVGNSVPGFSNNWGSANLSANPGEIGGFSKYSK